MFYRFFIDIFYRISYPRPPSGGTGGRDLFEKKLTTYLIVI
jgi:hypothetical protein